MPSARTLAVLKAVVSEYVHTATPVGSKAIVANHNVGVSSATIRNDLARLETTGHLTHPHVSAGRIPTDLGYRTVVENALATGAIAEAAMPEITAATAADGLRELAEALASMTNCLAVVSEPLPQVREIVRVSLVPLGHDRICCVVVCDDGSVSSQNLSAPDVGPELLSKLEAEVNSILAHRSLDHVSDLLGQMPPTLLATILELAYKLVLSSDEAACVRAGLSNLIEQPEFGNPENLRQMVHAVVDRELDFDALGATTGDLVVRIGHEHKDLAMRELGVVAKEYHVPSGIGFCSCVGPTRMNYAAAIAGVSACARAAKKLYEV
jgi:heat-inducible transcriptional repressor